MAGGRYLIRLDRVTDNRTRTVSLLGGGLPKGNDTRQPPLSPQILVRSISTIFALILNLTVALFASRLNRAHPG